MVEPDKFPVNTFPLTYKSFSTENLLVWYHSHTSSLILSIKFLRRHCILSFRTFVKMKTTVGLSIIPLPEHQWQFSSAGPLNPWLQPFQFGNLAIIFCSPNCLPIKAVFHQFGNRIFWEFVQKTTFKVNDLNCGSLVHKAGNFFVENNDIMHRWKISLFMSFTFWSLAPLNRGPILSVI